MNYLKLSLIGLGIFAIGLAIGYSQMPDKIKTVEKIVEKETTKKEEYKKTQKRYDPKTGKVIEETQETGTKETNSNETKTDKTTEKSKSRKLYAVKVGAAINPRDLTAKAIPRVAGEIALPFFNTWVGIESDLNISRPLLGVYGRMEF